MRKNNPPLVNKLAISSMLSQSFEVAIERAISTPLINSLQYKHHKPKSLPSLIGDISKNLFLLIPYYYGDDSIPTIGSIEKLDPASDCGAYFDLHIRKYNIWVTEMSHPSLYLDDEFGQILQFAIIIRQNSTSIKGTIKTADVY